MEIVDQPMIKQSGAVDQAVRSMRWIRHLMFCLFFVVHLGTFVLLLRHLMPLYL